jgi:predicted flap endonuclease-1-like 5' DNA nuclease
LDFLNLDFSQLEIGPIQYFLLHSGVFVGVLAAVFFILGLWFGGLTWGRYKDQKKQLQAENAQLKEEIAGLKRRVAESAVKAAPPPEPEPAPDPEPAGTTAPPAKPTPEVPEFSAEPAADPLPSLPIPVSPGIAETPAPETNVAPALTIAKPKPAQKSDPAEESAPFILGPIEAEKVDGEEGAQEPSTGVADAASLLSSQPSVPPSAGAIAPPPPASWKATRRIQLPAKEPAVTASAGDPEESETRIVDPESHPALGSIFTERPADPQIDDLKKIRGISRILEGQLNQFGVYTFAQIAAWTPGHVREFSSRLAFKDRIEREEWVEQAKALAS